MEPAWHPDPLGRHEFRWWDGGQWTDQVSDDGRFARDPLLSEAAPQPLPAPEPSVIPPVLPSADPVQLSRQDRSMVLVIGLGVLGVAIVGVLAAVLLSRGANDGWGITEATVRDNDGFVTRSFALKQGEAIRFRVEPSRRLDAEVAVVVDEATADDAADYMADELVDVFAVDDADEVRDRFFIDGDEVYRRGDIEAEFGSQVILQDRNVGGAGEPEADYMIALIDATYRLVVSPSEQDSTGDVRLIIERFEDGIELDRRTTVDDVDEFVAGRFFTERAFYESERSYSPDE